MSMKCLVKGILWFSLMLGIWGCTAPKRLETPQQTTLLPGPTRTITPSATQTKMPATAVPASLTVKSVTEFAPTSSPTLKAEEIISSTNFLEPGTYLVYWQEGTLYASSLDGTRRMALIQGMNDPGLTLSPDRRQMLYLDSRNGDIIEIMRYDFAHSRPEPSLSIESDLYFVDMSVPEYSPDGKFLTFVARTISRGEDGKAVFEENFSIFAILLAEGKVIRITSWESSEFWPTWSPDGKWIVFVSDHANVASPSSQNLDKLDLYRFPTNCLYEGKDCTPEFKQLTHSGKFAESSHSPMWFPDSRQIMYTCTLRGKGDNAKIGKTQSDICILGIDGTSTNLTNTPDSSERDVSCAWDWRKIVFERIQYYLEGSIENISGDLFTLDLDTKTETRLTFSPTPLELGPTWSPDGQHIAFSALTDRDLNDTFIISASGNGEEPVNLTRTVDKEEFFAFWLQIPPSQPTP